MKRTKTLCKQVLAYAISASLVFSGPLHAATTVLADGPLAQPASSVSPNMLLILDDSGSMSRQFTPDYISSNSHAGTVLNCFDNRDSLEGGASPPTANPKDCYPGDPPAMSPDFNTQYYNPQIRYFPAVEYDGTSKGDMTCAATGGTVAAGVCTGGWTTTPTDNVSASTADQARKAPHDKNPTSASPQGTHWDNVAPTTPQETMDLVTGFPDRVWCSDPAALISDTASCRTNSSYSYPDNTFGFNRDTSSNRKFKFGAPYYYRILPTEHCTNDTLTTCTASTSPTVVAGVNHFVPAPVRFCNSTALTTCQAKRDSTFKYPKFLGTVNTAAAVGTGIKARGKIVLSTGDSGATTITQIKVTVPTTPTPTDVNLLGADIVTVATNSAAGRLTAANAIINAINLNSGGHNYVAILGPHLTSGADTTDILIDAPTAGVAHNGTSITVTAPVTSTTPASLSFTIGSAANGDKVNSIKIGPVSGPTVDLLPAGGATCTNNNNSTCAGIVRAAINNNTTLGLAHGYSASGTTATTTITAESTSGSERNGWVLVWSDTGLNDPPPGTALAGGVSVGDLTHTPSNFTNGADPNASGWARENVGTFVRTDIVSGRTYPKFPARTDCAAATTCTYEEEMTNFANWFAYYRTRVQMAKTSIGRAFLFLSSNFRVGFMTINFTAGNYLAVNDFTPGATGHKKSWFDKLYNAPASGNTPLRGALARAGQYYANKRGGAAGSIDSSMGASPINKSCQPSFAILTSDGYWNDADTVATRENNTTQVGDQDSTDSGYSTKAAGAWDGLASSNMLADVAMYYYKTDLRSDLSDFVPTTQKDTAPHQHMVTFTVGMGLAGTLRYDQNYETQTSGDFFDIKQGTKFWPLAASLQETTIDDLWHAAVNGRGKFFSAQDPVALSSGIAETLNAVQARVGAGAAAATSNLQPVAGDNFAFTAQYQTVEWSGDVKARTIDLSTGTVATRELWSAQVLLDQRSPTDRRIYTFDASDTSSTAVITVAPKTVTSLTQLLGIATAVTATAHGFADGDPVTIAGAAPAGYNGDVTITLVDATTFKYSVSVLLGSPAAGTITAATPRNQNGNKLRSFCWTTASAVAPYTPCDDGGLLTTAEMDAHFDPMGGPNSQLAQSVTWPTDGSLRHLAATKPTLVDYIRGDVTNEMAGAGTSTTDLYRNRAHLLGDVVNAQPAYVKQAPFEYLDPFYSDYRATTATRLGTVYVAANDGMLHAFETDPDSKPYFQTKGIATAETSDDEFTGTLSTDPVSGEGSERWAYIPTLVFPVLKRLAEKDYSNQHVYSVDGSPVVGDVCFDHTTAVPCASAANWRTVLVGGLNKGGRGYYALDVTDPANPKGLWELKGGTGAACLNDTQANSGTFGADCNIGLSFGNPLIVKRPSDGKWVVLVTSGHNNVSPGNGKGYLYVVDIQTGLILQRLGTGVGCDASNSTAPCSSTDDPSGLARINAWVDKAVENNTALTVYGGDLKGNLWRFQLQNTAAVGADTITRIATLEDPSGSPQEITTRPELGEVKGPSGTPHRFIYVGAGKFLGVPDKETFQRQTMYAIKDPMLNATSPVYADTRAVGGFVEQTLTASATTRKASANPVNIDADPGWFVDLPDGGTATGATAPAPAFTPTERINVDPVLQLGTLVVPSNVPSADDCVAGGHGWVNFFDYKTGSYVTGSTGGVTSQKIAASLVVGINVVQLPGGTVKTIVTTADNQQLTQSTPVSATSVSGRRVTWRELLVE